LLLDTEVLDEALVALRSVGIDEVYGFAEAETVLAQADNLASYENVSPSEANEMVEKGEAYVLDVRNQTEFDEGHIDNAEHIMVGTLKNRLDEVDTDKTIIVQCQAGARSAIAASVLKANGIDNLVNMTGGYSKWQQEVASVKQ